MGDEQPVVSEDEASPRRKWIAIVLGTMVLFFSYGGILVGVAATQEDAVEAAGPAYAVGFALVPVVFLVVAFISRRPNAPIQVLKAMGVWLLVALPFGLVNPILGLAAAFGLGGVLTVRQGPTDQWRARTIGVLAAAIYSFAMLFVIPGFGLISGAILPLTTIGFVDYYTANKARARG